MKNKFIRLAALLLAMLLLVGVVGCSGGSTNTDVSLATGGGEDSGDTPDQIRIQQQISTMGEDIVALAPGAVDSMYNEMCSQRYNQLTGGTVTWVSSNGYSEMQQKLASMHMTDETPDVYDFTNQDYPSILYKNLLAPLDDLLDLDDPIFADKKLYIEALRWDGKCYFIPQIGTDRDLWVNKQILIDAGIPESEWPDAQYKAGTWTWDTYLDLIKRVSDPDKGIYGTVYDVNLHMAYPASAGVDFVKLTDTGFVSNAKDENVTRAMTLYKETITNPNYAPVNSNESAMELFKRGKVCMWYYMRSAPKDEVIGEQLANGDIFFTAFPRDPKVSEYYRMGDIFGKAIPQSAKHKTGAAAFILSLYASDYYQKQFDALEKDFYNWTDELIDYYDNDLSKRPAVICFTLGFKEIQSLIAGACFRDIYTMDWPTVANTLDPAVQKEIDTQQ